MFKQDCVFEQSIHTIVAYLYSAINLPPEYGYLDNTFSYLISMVSLAHFPFLLDYTYLFHYISLHSCNPLVSPPVLFTYLFIYLLQVSSTFNIIFLESNDEFCVLLYFFLFLLSSDALDYSHFFHTFGFTNTALIPSPSFLHSTPLLSGVTVPTPLNNS